MGPEVGTGRDCGPLPASVAGTRNSYAAAGPSQQQQEATTVVPTMMLPPYFAIVVVFGKSKRLFYLTPLPFFVGKSAFGKSWVTNRNPMLKRRGCFYTSWPPRE